MRTKRLYYTPHSGLVAVFALLLTAAPRMNVKIGPMPLYFIDLVVALMLYYALRTRGFGAGKRPFGGVVGLIFGLALASESMAFLLSGGSIEAIYIVGRTVLAFSVFFSVGQLVRTPADLQRVLKAAVIGLLVTASLMILTSLPMTRSFVINYVFSWNFLEPAAAGSLLERYLEMQDTGQRGRTLVGVSIMGATFINVCWPLAAILAIWPNSTRLWRTLAALACLVAPMAVVMSYSRGPILGMILMILAVLVLGLRYVRRRFIVPVVVGAIAVAIIGVGSEIFFFDRLINRTDVMLTNPYEDERETERLFAYVEPFEHVLENPFFLVLGEGSQPGKLGMWGEQSDKATHALFAKAYYSYGMIAALLYHLLVLDMLYYTVRHIQKRGTGISLPYRHALILSVVALLPWVAFGHAMISAPRGAMLFFFVVGLLTTLRHFPVMRFSHSQA